MKENTQPAVCLLIASFHPIVGGGETHARLLSRELIARGHPVFVMTRLSDLAGKVYEEVDKIPVFRLRVPASPRWGKYRMLFRSFLELVRLRDRYDVIYVCGLRVLGVVGVLAARWLGKKCILRAEACGEFSGAFIWDSPHRTRLRPFLRLLRPLVVLRNGYLKKADIFLAISETIRDEFLEGGVPAERIRMIPNGIDTERFCPADEAMRERLRRDLHLPAKKLFMYSGKLDLGKGLEMLLSLWAQFVREFPESHLVLVGGGKDHFLSCEETLKQFVEEKNLRDHVTFTGYVTNVQEYLRAADVFTFPSDKEAFGLAPLEAMACGLPTVATRTGGLPSVIRDGENGLLADPGDREQFYAGLVRLAKDPDGARRMGAQARKTIEEKYGIRRIAEQHSGLFKALTCGESGE